MGLIAWGLNPVCLCVSLTPSCVSQSRELLQTLLLLEPDNTRALGMLGTLEWKAGNPVLARKHLMEGIQADSTHVANLHSLARLELEEGKLEEARKLFARGQELEPNNAYILQVAQSPYTLRPCLSVPSPFAFCCCRS